MTLLHWRKPTMVPKAAKIRRVDCIKECIVMAHMLTITNFFRDIVARRHHKRVSAKLARRQNFLAWSHQDPHRMRRAVHSAQLRKREKEYAEKLGLQHWQVCACVCVCVCLFEFEFVCVYIYMYVCVCVFKQGRMSM